MRIQALETQWLAELAEAQSADARSRLAAERERAAAECRAIERRRQGDFCVTLLHADLVFVAFFVFRTALCAFVGLRAIEKF